MNPKMFTSFVDGSKTLVEMAALANFLVFQIGFLPLISVSNMDLLEIIDCKEE